MRVYEAAIGGSKDWNPIFVQCTMQEAAEIFARSIPMYSDIECVHVDVRNPDTPSAVFSYSVHIDRIVRARRCHR